MYKNARFKCEIIIIYTCSPIKSLQSVERIGKGVKKNDMKDKYFQTVVQQGLLILHIGTPLS